MKKKFNNIDPKRFEDKSYLRTLSIPELKFLLIFLEDDSLVQQTIEEKRKDLETQENNKQ